MKRSRALFQKRCKYCKKIFQNPAQVSRHVAHSDSCQQQWEKEVQNLPARPAPLKQLPEKMEEKHDYDLDADEVDIDHNDYVLPAPLALDLCVELHIEGLVEGRLETQGVDENADDTIGSAYRHTRWTEAYPRRVAQGYGRAKTTFEGWRNEQMLRGASQWSPFKDEEEWELTLWLFKNVGQSAIDEYLKLPSVSF
jgi:hypothetical protein